MANVYSNARNSYYAISGYPTYKFDGIQQIVGGISNWASTAAGIIDARLLEKSDFTIDIEFEEADGDYNAEVTVENVGGNTSSNLVLQFVITESKLPIVWGGMDEQDFVNRLMVPNQNGTALDFSGGNTQVVDLNFNTSFWDTDNCTMVAFVQDNSNKEILQGTQKFMAIAGFNIDAEAKALKHPIGDYCGNTVEPVVTIKNMGSDPLTSLDIEYSINGGTAQTFAWTGELEFNMQEDVTLPEIEFMSEPENTFEFTVSNPNGETDPNPDNDTFEGMFNSAFAAPTNTVLLELKTDNYPEETTWEVTNSAGDVMYSGGPYNGQQGTIFNETFEFEDDDCYTFGIYDAYGDGICCQYGQGYYKLMDENSVAFMEGGEFGSEEFTPFSIGGPPPPPPAGNCEGFDELTVGGYAAEQLGGNWTTWSGAPGGDEDAIVSDAYSLSPSNSIVVEGITDLVHLITGENITSGKWSYSLNIYVPTGTAGYYNLQKDVIPGTEWGFQVMFEDDGTIVVDGGAAAALVQPFEYDTWIHHEVIVDLDNDWCQLYINGELAHEYQWTLGTFGTPGANTLAGSNIYANDGTGGAPAGAHFDDICFEELSENESCENFDDLTVGGYVAEQLGGNWTTWSGAPGGDEDAIVSDAYSLSPSNSIVVEGITDLVHLITGENITSGKWSYSLNIYVPTGTAGYYNLQKDVIPGTEWGFQVMFEDDGTIVVDGGAAAALVQPFEYDTWINHEVVVDLDNDWCQLYIDGDLAHEYQWTLGTFGTPGANTLAGSNIYANDGTGGAPAGAYFDDICFEQLSGSDDCEYFDDLTVGGYVAEQLGDPWTTWSGEPGGAEDAFVSDMHSYSGANSFAIDAGTIDLIYKLAEEPITEGQWVYSNYIYVPTGFSGYFNVQSEPTPNVAWVVELFFNDDGTGTVTQNSIDVDFTYTPDTWILVEVAFDLDMGLGEVWFDGEWFYQWEVGTSIGGIDYYGWDVGGTPGAYYDDVCFGEGWEIIPTGIGQEISKTENISIYPNPAKDIVNISVANDLSRIMVFDYMGNLVIEKQVSGNDCSINTSHLSSGVYVFRIMTDEGFTTKQVVIK